MLHRSKTPARAVTCALHQTETAAFITLPAAKYRCATARSSPKLRGCERSVATVRLKPGPDQQLRSTVTAVLAGKRVLLCEDRTLPSEALRADLCSLGVVLAVAQDDAEGLAQTAEGSFDVVLCDCISPKTKGYEFVRMFRQRERENRSAHTPVIALTENVFDDEMRKGRAAGVDDFITMPMSPERLGAVLAHWLTGAGWSAAVRATTGANETAIDITVLTKLLGTGDSAILAEVLGEFAVSMEKSWAEVRTALAGSDRYAVRSAAHGAKGEAFNAGARTLGSLYAEIEASAGTHASAGGAEIEREVERVRDFIAQFTQGRATA